MAVSCACILLYAFSLVMQKYSSIFLVCIVLQISDFWLCFAHKILFCNGLKLCADFTFLLKNCSCLLSFCRTSPLELLAQNQSQAGIFMQPWKERKKHQKSRNRLVIQMTLYFAFLFLVPFTRLLLVALSQSSFLSFYSTFPLLTSSVSLHTNGKRELRVTCAGSCFFASA